MRLVAGPLVGRLADAMASLRLVLAVSIAMAAAAAAAFLAINTFWFVLLIALVQAAALAPTTSIADALTVNTATPHLAGKPLEYGWPEGLVAPSPRIWELARFGAPAFRVLVELAIRVSRFFVRRSVSTLNPETSGDPESLVRAE